MNKMFSPVFPVNSTLLAWVPPDLSLSVSLSCSPFRVRNTWEICIQLWGKRRCFCRSLTRTRRKVTPLCYSTPAGCVDGTKWTLVKPAPSRIRKKKNNNNTPSLPASSPLLRLYVLPSRPLSNNLCLSEQARFHSSPAQYFISLKEKKKMSETDQSVWETWQMQ